MLNIMPLLRNAVSRKVAALSLLGALAAWPARSEPVLNGLRSGVLSRERVAATWPGAPTLLAQPVAQAPVVDGDPGDVVWQSAEPVTLGYFAASRSGHPLRNETVVRTLCDDSNLYVLFVCREENIQALKIGSSNVWEDDVCELLLDVGKTEDICSGACYEIEANPIGHIVTSRIDGHMWRPVGVTVRTKIDTNQWTVEMRVPFADLALQAGAVPAVWGANFMRSRAVGRVDTDESAKDSDFAWVPNTFGSPHIATRFGSLLLATGRMLPPKLVAEYKRSGADFEGLGFVPMQPRLNPTEPAEPPLPKSTTWAAKPTVDAGTNKATIRFAAAEPTDVAVWVQDEKSRTVRHLAAGRLGPTAPAPLQAGTLAQTLIWDYRDDYRKAVPPGAYSIRVGFALRADLDRVLLGAEPQITTIQGLAAARDGRLYVLTRDRCGAHNHISRILCYDRHGHYIREVYPMSGDQPADRVAGAAPIALPGGGWMPVVHQGLLHSLVPQMGMPSMQRAAVAPDGRLVLVNGSAEIRMGIPKRLLLLGADGSVDKSYAGPILARDPVGGAAAIALSPDGRYAYVTGLAGDNMEGGKPHEVVYRMALTGDAAPRTGDFATPFLGEFRKPAADEKHFHDPRGVATDAAGQIYVADSRNDRVAVFGSDGQSIRAIAVPHPVQVEVDAVRKTIYVLSEKDKNRRLIKFAPLDAPREVCAIDVPAATGTPAILCLDAGAELPMLWLPTAPETLCRVTDSGDALKLEDGALGGAKRLWGPIWHGLPMRWFELSHDEAVIHVSGAAYDAATGAKLEPRPECYFRGLDGRLYTFENGFVNRFESDGKPAPFPGKEKKGLRAPRAYYVCVDAAGNLYAAENRNEPGMSRIVKYGSDGVEQAEPFVSMPMPVRSSGPVATLVADWDGGIFVSSFVRAPDRALPAFVAGRLPSDTGVSPSPQIFYEQVCGSVTKFGPAGGWVKIDPEGDTITGVNYGGLQPCRTSGIQWSHIGISPLVCRNRDHARCTCEHASFGADGFRRLFIPNAYRFSVDVVDRNGNELLRFGRYGNADDRPKAAATQDLPMGWPICARAGDGVCYVADMLNDRLLRVRLSYAAEEQQRVEVKP